MLDYAPSTTLAGRGMDVDDENRGASGHVAKNKSGDVGMVRMAFVKDKPFHELQRGT